jgi:hypothetical protein
MLKLISARMEWYFDQDEIDDSAWDAWPKHRDRQRPLSSAPVEREHEVHWSERPENYWPRQLELEVAMRTYEQNKENSEP